MFSIPRQLRTVAALGSYTRNGAARMSKHRGVHEPPPGPRTANPASLREVPAHLGVSPFNPVWRRPELAPSRRRTWLLSPNPYRRFTCRLRTRAALRSIEQPKSNVSVTEPRLAVIVPEIHWLRLLSIAVELKFTFW